MWDAQSPQPFKLRRKSQIINRFYHHLIVLCLLSLALGWCPPVARHGDAETSDCCTTVFTHTHTQMICKVIKSQVSAWQLHNKPRILVFSLIKMTPVRLFFKTQFSQICFQDIHTVYTLQAGLFETNFSAIHILYLSKIFGVLL